MHKLFANTCLIFLIITLIQIILINVFDSGIEFIHQDHTTNLSRSGFLLLSTYLTLLFGFLTLDKLDPSL